MAHAPCETEHAAKVIARIQTHSRCGRVAEVERPPDYGSVAAGYSARARRDSRSWRTDRGEQNARSNPNAFQLGRGPRLFGKLAGGRNQAAIRRAQSGPCFGSCRTFGSVECFGVSRLSLWTFCPVLDFSRTETRRSLSDAMAGYRLR